ncbi:hypothetical protein ACER0C_002668 [Sarotherodon galilaeus]
MKMFVVFVILLHVSQHALAVVVEVYEEAKSVLLPCQYSGIIPENNPTVMWTRSDLSPTSVHLRREEGDDLKKQNLRYSGRTSMRPDALETSDFSLTLTNPELIDSGVYTCSISDGKEETGQRNVQLKVKEPFPSWATALMVLLVLLIFGGLLFNFRYYFKSVYKVEVDSGVESVQLPCKTLVNFLKDPKVEWKDRMNRKVHVYQNDSDHHDEQDQIYNNRTKMKRNLVKPGDFSLTLKYPTDGDTNTYTCTVYSKKGKESIKKEVELRVRVPIVEVEQSGVESVQLPLQIKVNRPNDSKVELVDSSYRMLYVYRNNSDQPEEQDRRYRNRTEMNEDLLITGDLSLTLAARNAQTSTSEKPNSHFTSAWHNIEEPPPRDKTQQFIGI